QVRITLDREDGDVTGGGAGPDVRGCGQPEVPAPDLDRHAAEPRVCGELAGAAGHGEVEVGRHEQPDQGVAGREPALALGHRDAQIQPEGVDDGASLLIRIVAVDLTPDGVLGTGPDLEVGRTQLEDGVPGARGAE